MRIWIPKRVFLKSLNLTVSYRLQRWPDRSLEVEAALSVVSVLTRQTCVFEAGNSWQTSDHSIQRGRRSCTAGRRVSRRLK